MIVKRKSQSISTKTKPKDKQPKNNEKKIKKQTKLHVSASMHHLKVGVLHAQKNSKPHPHPHLHHQNENINCLNTHTNHKFLNDHKFEETQTVRESRQCKNSKMRKSVSVGILRNNKTARRSLSPMIIKENKDQKPLDIKHRYNSRHTSRSQKQFPKQKLKTLIKKVEQPKKKTTKTGKSKIQRSSRQDSDNLKTQISSKMPSVNKETDKKVSKKHSKTMKMKDFIKIHKKSGSKEKKTKKKVKNSLVFSDVSFNDISNKKSNKSNRMEFFQDFQELAIKIKAAITIQRHFRGYLTRKYIEEAKMMTYFTIKIQKAFRGYACRKKLKNMKKYLQFPIAQNHNSKKNLSIENSLITIKDFSEQVKQQKHKKFKFFNFDENLSSQKEQLKNNLQTSDRLQSDRQSLYNMAEANKKNQSKKYVEILEDLLREEGLQQKLKSRIRDTLKTVDPQQSDLAQQPSQKSAKKQFYVQNKIHSEIISEKSFNSPRSLCSPKGNLFFTSPSSSSKNPCISPNCQNKLDKINQRIVSPCKQQSINNSAKKVVFQTQKKEIKPFDTSFQFIEEFELIIVDFLRDNPQMKDLFLTRVKNCELHRTNLVLLEWDKFEEEPNCCDYLIPKFAYTQQYAEPVIFDQKMKELILEEPAMKIHLQERNYLQSGRLGDQQQKQAYDGYINLIFDGLSQAIYKNYRNQIVSKPTKFYGCMYEGHNLFKFILMNSLTHLQGWCEYLGGLEIPVDQNDPNYPIYIQKNNERMELIVSSELKPITRNQYSSWILWLCVMMGEILFQEISEQLSQIFYGRKSYGLQ